jgi:pimeloyl-[acyl-carrier protein] methyl ester esterase
MIVAVAATRPLPVMLLPGLDGSTDLFARFLARATGALDFRRVPYPRDRFLDYAELERLVWPQLPRGEPFAILGESFGGPLTLKIAAGKPPGLVGVVLAATFFRLPRPPHVVRLLLAGGDAPPELVEEVREAVRRVPAAVMAARAHEAIKVDASEALRLCPVPLLFLGGKKDRLLRSTLPSEIRALQPRAEVRMLDTPHLVLQRKPEESMKIVEEFLLRCSAAHRGAQEPSTKPVQATTP